MEMEGGTNVLWFVRIRNSDKGVGTVLLCGMDMSC